MTNNQGIRNARKNINASCLMLHQGHSYIMEVCNISASGILLLHDEEKFENDLKIGSVCVLEIVVNESFNLHVESEVIRLDSDKIAFHYTKIPEDKQISLWQLLGEHVHETETRENP